MNIRSGGSSKQSRPNLGQHGRSRNDESGRLPCIVVDDVSLEVFEVLLRFIYTDSVGDLGSEWAWASETQRLLDAAERYLMLSMKVCSGHPIPTVTISC